MKSALKIILNKATKTATIDIDGFIGADWSKEKKDQNTKERLKAELRAIANIKADTIVVNINSYGGNSNHGISIYDLLVEHQAKVITKINGMTASAATIIAAAGDERKMSDNSLALIHTSSILAWGNKNELKASIQTLEAVDTRMLNIYAKTGGQDKKVYEDLMNENNGNGIWIDAEKMKEIGLVTEVFEPKKVAAVANFDFEAHNLPVPDNDLLAKCKVSSSQDSNNLANEIWAKIKDFISPQTDNSGNSLNQNNMSDTKLTLEQLQSKMDEMQKTIEAQAETIDKLQKPASEGADPKPGAQKGPVTLEQLQANIAKMQETIDAQAETINKLKDEPGASHTGGDAQDPDTGAKAEWQIMEEKIQASI